MSRSLPIIPRIRTMLMMLAALLATASAGANMAMGQAAGTQSPLVLPAPASQTRSVIRNGATYALAIGPWNDGWIDMLQVTGDVTIESWRLPSRGGQTGAVMAELAGQLSDAGYEILFQCAQDQCGGFDFRFALEVVPEPAMHVDLGDYQYLAARKPHPEGIEYLSLLVSSSPGAGFVQIVRVTPDGSAPVPVSAPASPAPTTPAPEPRPTPQADATTTPAADAPTTDAPTPTTGTPPPNVSTALATTDAPTLAAATIAEQLEQNGHAVLSDLTFKPGSSDLGDGPFPSLAELARYLRDHPDRHIALVGHSDAQGSLATNIALSEQRALSVRKRLIEKYGVTPKQLLAKGVGYLSPIASNLTEAGRTLNRRVEAVLISTR